MSKEAMKLALEALKRMKRYGDTFAYRSYEQNPHEQVCEAITAIEALAEQPVQRPWVVPDFLTTHDPETPEYRNGWNDCRQLMMEMHRKEIK